MTSGVESYINGMIYLYYIMYLLIRKYDGDRDTYSVSIFEYGNREDIEHGAVQSLNTLHAKYLQIFYGLLV